MKEYLEAVGTEKSDLSEEFVLRYTTRLGDEVTDDEVAVYRALKALTTPLSEARKIVGTVNVIWIRTV